MLVRDVVAGLLSVRVEATAVLMLMLMLLLRCCAFPIMLLLLILEMSKVEPQMAGSSDVFLLSKSVASEATGRR